MEQDFQNYVIGYKPKRYNKAPENYATDRILSHWKLSTKITGIFNFNFLVSWNARRKFTLIPYASVLSS